MSNVNLMKHKWVLWSVGAPYGIIINETKETEFLL